MKKNWKPILVVIVLILIVVAATVIGQVIEKYTPSKEKADLYTEYKVEKDSNEVAIILQDELIEEKALIEDGVVYLDFDMVKETFNHRFYFDVNEEVMLYTTPDSLIRCVPGETTYKVNKKKKEKEYEIVKLHSEDTITKVYVALDFVKEYTALDYEYYKKPNRVCITYKWGDISICKTKEEVAVRVGANIKSPIMTNLEKKKSVRVIKEKGKWYQVMTEDGIIGYAQKKQFAKQEKKTLKTDFKEPEYTSIKREEKINMVWHQVVSYASNDNMPELIADSEGINVIAPTWFRLSDNKGNLQDWGDANYVKVAHKLGYEVWAMLDDQAAESDDSIVLAKTSARQNIVSNLMDAVETYDLDGINVDLEYITEANAENYLQFLRELSIECRKAGIVMSIDNYVPKAYNLHYDRTEQGILADYVVIMGYDEHNNGSEQAGSVASLPFVKEGIEATLQEVPAEKVILAAPFYTRIWEETPEEYAESGSTIYENQGYRYSLSSRALGMDDALAEVKDNGAELAWNEELGQNYASWEKDNTTYMVWMEDEKSLEAKMKLVKEYKLAGAAAWRLGLENDKVWNVMKKYLK